MAANTTEAVGATLGGWVMTNLRTGLVEAMARADHRNQAHRECSQGFPGELWQDCGRAETHRETAMVHLDAALGFLTDNAEAWTEAALGYEPDDLMVKRGLLFIAALSDSRDTGEKP